MSKLGDGSLHKARTRGKGVTGDSRVCGRPCRWAGNLSRKKKSKWNGARRTCGNSRKRTPDHLLTVPASISFLTTVESLRRGWILGEDVPYEEEEAE